MKALIVDDDFFCRRLVRKFLSAHGDCDIAVNGNEAIEAVSLAWDEKEPYDLLCLDIDMPELDGHATLKEIRRREEERGTFLGRGVLVIMTTAHKDPKNFLGAFREGCEAYLVKPITKEALLEQVQKLGLLGN